MKSSIGELASHLAWQGGFFTPASGLKCPSSAALGPDHMGPIKRGYHEDLACHRGCACSLRARRRVRSDAATCYNHERPWRSAGSTRHGNIVGWRERGCPHRRRSFVHQQQAHGGGDSGDRRLGVPDKDIRTSNFSVSLQYANSNNEPPRVTGYQAGNQVEVRLEDVNKLGIVLDGLVTAGANQMHGVSFLIRNDTDLLSRARTAAVAEARAKAQTFATAAGVTLGPILSIIENGNSGPRPVFFAAAKATTASVPVALGEETISADVTITWEIK